MSTQIQRRRGTTAEHSTFTGALGEITVDTSKDTLVIHDGSTVGGFPLAKEANGIVLLGSVAGTNTITATGSPTQVAYVVNKVYVVTPANTNTGATTVNVDGLGAKNVFIGGLACEGYELRQGVPVLLQYDGTQMNIIGPFVSEPISFVPALSGAGSTFAYSIQTGRYIKVGKFRFGRFRIVLATSGNTLGASEITITGFPSTTTSNAPLAISEVHFSNMTTSLIKLTGRFGASGTTMSLFKQTAAATTDIGSNLVGTDLHATNGTELIGSFFYEAA